MSKLEICDECGEPTGYAGKGEDSLYLEDAGPYCDGCYDGLPAEPTSLVIEKLVMLRDDFGPVRGNEDARHIVSLAITRLLEIEKDNERLSHNQCLHEILGDDYGNLRCSKVDFLSRELAERDAALMEFMDEKDLLDEFQFWLNGSVEDAINNRVKSKSPHQDRK